MLSRHEILRSGVVVVVVAVVVVVGGGAPAWLSPENGDSTARQGWYCQGVRVRGVACWWWWWW